MSAQPAAQNRITALQLIDDINARQDEALRQLDELNQQIESLVELCAATARQESTDQTLKISDSDDAVTQPDLEADQSGGIAADSDNAAGKRAA